MLIAREKYDPAIYGKLRSEFLNKLNVIPPCSIEPIEEKQEKIRREIIKELKERTLVSIKT